MRFVIRHLLAKIISDICDGDPEIIARLVARLRTVASRQRFVIGFEAASELRLLANAIELERGTFDQTA
jgi:hypothetical protein